MASSVSEKQVILARQNVPSNTLHINHDSRPGSGGFSLGRPQRLAGGAVANTELACYGAQAVTLGPHAGDAGGVNDAAWTPERLAAAPGMAQPGLHSLLD